MSYSSVEMIQASLVGGFLPVNFSQLVSANINDYISQYEHKAFDSRCVHTSTAKWRHGQICVGLGAPGRDKYGIDSKFRVLRRYNGLD